MGVPSFFLRHFCELDRIMSASPPSRVVSIECGDVTNLPTCAHAARLSGYVLSLQWRDRDGQSQHECPTFHREKAEGRKGRGWYNSSERGDIISDVA